MKALTFQPGINGSARLDDVPPPPASTGDVVVAIHSVGVCGTDRELLAGEYGEAPPGSDRLILGHEAVGRVIEAPAGAAVVAGDWVVPIVRHRDPVPCANCAIDEWDMCRNGQYTEHGIKGRHGFCVEQLRTTADRLVRVDAALGPLAVLLEPASIIAKAWEHIDRMATRSAIPPRTVLVTGAGPIGLLAALFATQRGHDVRVFDRAADGIKPQQARTLGARYATRPLDELVRASDVIVECTGAPPVVLSAMSHAPANAIVCLTGVSPRLGPTPVDVGELDRGIVLENNVVFGTVNANRRHYEVAEAALCRADRTWLDALIGRRTPLAHWERALEKSRDVIKSVIEIA